MLEKHLVDLVSTINSTQCLLTLLCLTLLTWYILWRNSRYSKLIRKIPGISAWPLFGDVPYLKSNPRDALQQFLNWADERRKDGIYRFMFMERPWVMVFSSEGVEKLCNCNVNITKSEVYQPLHKWIGHGLLTSTGNKWKSRRRMITPAFHFSILKDFVVLMNNHARDLKDKLMREACNTGEPYDVVNDFTLSTLDIICDTAMGVEIGALNGGHSKYVEALQIIKHGLDERSRSVIDQSDFIYNLRSHGKKVNKAMELAQDFTMQVIKERQDAKRLGQSYDEANKKHKPFLDLLLDCRDENGQPLTDSDIREEVDTFMFEGHDTTSSGISFVIYLLGRNIEAQKRCQKELDDIIADPSQSITTAELSKMNYLECCIKESLRILPPVPFIGRELSEDTEIAGYMVPKGTMITMMIMALARNPEVFPNPDQFDPDRFTQQNCVKRNPFDYVPFSAGPRNCVGQKFAMMEMKIVIATLLQHFNIESTQTRDELGIRPALVLQPDEGVKVKLTSRH